MFGQDAENPDFLFDAAENDGIGCPPIACRYHRVTPHYMLDYAEETSWREHVRRKNTVEQLFDLGKRVFNARRSVDWLNYSHGRHRTVELLFVASKANPNPLHV